MVLRRCLHIHGPPHTQGPGWLSPGTFWSHPPTGLLLPKSFAKGQLLLLVLVSQNENVNINHSVLKHRKISWTENERFEKI